LGKKEKKKNKFNSEDKNTAKKMKNEKIFQKKSSYYILRTLLTHKEDPSPLVFFI